MNETIPYEQRIGHTVLLTLDLPRTHASTLLQVGYEVSRMHATQATFDQLVQDEALKQTHNAIVFNVPYYASSFDVYIALQDDRYQVTIARKTLQEDMDRLMLGATPMYLNGVHWLLEWAEHFEQDVRNLTLLVRNEDLATPDIPQFDLSNWDW